VATFLAYYDAVRPWRRLAASFRSPVSRQKRAFVQTYQEHAGPFEPIDEALLRLAHVRALVMFVGQLQSSGSWARSLSARARRLAMQGHFRRVCEEHLAGLRGPERRSSHDRLP
jgi:hypothetical protein